MHIVKSANENLFFSPLIFPITSSFFGHYCIPIVNQPLILPLLIKFGNSSQPLLIQTMTERMG